MRSKQNAANIAMGGLMMAVILVALYASSIISNIRMSLLAITALAGTVLVLEMGARTATIVYIGASILSFFLLPDKLSFLIYALLCGNYPILKFQFEKIKSPAVQWTVKLLYFLIASGAAAAAYVWLFGGSELAAYFADKDQRSIYAAPIVMILVFVAINYPMTRLAALYKSKWQKRMRSKRS